LGKCASGTSQRRWLIFDGVCGRTTGSKRSRYARPTAPTRRARLALLEPSDRVWLLERSGELLTSEEVARRIERLPHEGIARLTVVVAGTYGASEQLLARADLRWSLSRLTFLHEWARALAVEQLYRAAKIARDEPYHH
jgi:rRNA large subunit m3Psi methyltransferase RlmH